MGIWPACSFNQLVHNMFGRGLVWITHTKVDDVLATMAGRYLELVDRIKYVRRKAFDAREMILAQDWFNLWLNLDWPGGAGNPKLL